MISTLTQRLTRLLSSWIGSNDDVRGQTLVEYGLLLAFIFLIVVVALMLIGPIISTMFLEVGDGFP